MTFDEAIKEIDNALDLIDYDEDMPNKIYEVFSKLREEYAPTVEMTKEQARVLNEYREPDLYDGDDTFYVFFDETCVPRLNSMRDTSLYENLTEAQLMQAWLHPDDIQIIDKE